MDSYQGPGRKPGAGYVLAPRQRPTHPRPVNRWRVLALALGEKAHADPRIADRVALVRLVILLSYLTTNTFIIAGVIRHWPIP